MNYKVGDKVIIRKWDDMEKEFGLDSGGDIKAECCFVRPMREYCGKKMTIGEITCGGNYTMVNGGGWIFSADTFEKNNNQKIVITTDGTETLARLYEGDKVVKKATAKCSPDDTFDFNVGAKIAFERLIESPSEKKEKYYNGKVVCVYSTGSNERLYTVGKIYQFVDGQMTCDNGIKMPCYKHIKNFEEWDEFSSSDFVEIVE